MLIDNQSENGAARQNAMADAAVTGWLSTARIVDSLSHRRSSIFTPGSAFIDVGGGGAGGF
jgi:hypothetical protein